MPARGIPQIKMPDHELIDARYTISTLQTALDRATALVRELQTTVGALNERVAIGNEQIEDLALDLAMERLRAEIADTADAQRARTWLKVVYSSPPAVQSGGHSTQSFGLTGRATFGRDADSTRASRASDRRSKTRARSRRIQGNARRALGDFPRLQRLRARC